MRIGWVDGGGKYGILLYNNGILLYNSWLAQL